MGRHLHRLAGNLERLPGIEPESYAWKASALPLSYDRFELVDQEGLEPSPNEGTPDLQSGGLPFAHRSVICSARTPRWAPRRQPERLWVYKAV